MAKQRKVGPGGCAIVDRHPGFAPILAARLVLPVSAVQSPTPGPSTGRSRRWIALCGSGLRLCSTTSLRFLRWLFVLVLAFYLVFGAALLALRYAVLPNIDNYRATIEQQASKALGVPVAIGDVEADWYGLRPRLTLKDVQIHQTDGRLALRVPQASAVLSWWSLPLMGAYLRSLRIEAPELEVRRLVDGRIVVAGFTIDPAVAGDGRFAEWMFGQREVAIRDARVRYIDDAQAGAPIEFAAVGVLMRNQGVHHLFALRAVPPAALASAIDLRADFRHTPLIRRASDWRAWRGEVYTDLGYADVGAIAQRVKLPIEIRRGEGAVRAWLALDHGRVDRLTADVALRAVEARAADNLPMLELQTVRGRVTAREIADKDAAGPTTGHEVVLDDFSFRTADGLELATADITERLLFRADGSVAAGAFAASALDLDALAKLGAHLPLSSEHRALLARLEPRGAVSALRYDWTGAIATPVRYNLSARFSALALRAQASDAEPDPGHPLRPRLGRPGFDNLAGRVEMSDKGGRMQIDAARAALTFPGLFADPEIHLDRLVAQADWDRTPQGVALRVSNASFRNADASGTIAGTYASGGKGPGMVNFEGRLAQADARAVHRYLPLSVPEDTRHWVRTAVLAGASSEVTFRLRGDLWDFPYIKPAEGDFRIAAKLRGGKLNFAPDLAAANANRPAWPVLEDIVGELVFERNGFSIANASAKTLGVQLARVNVRMADFSDPQHLLEIKGQVGGPLRAMVDYVGLSPVGGWIGGFLADARATGDARLALQLNLPIAKLEASRVRGELQFADNEISIDPTIPTFSRVTGMLEFTESGAGFRAINATFLGGPVRIDGAPRADSAITLRAEGSASAAALWRHLDIAALERASGSARYTAQLAVRGGAVEFAADSDLVGVGLDLPAPLAKAAPTALPLRIRVKPVATGADESARGTRRERIEASLGPAVAAVIERERRTGAAGARMLRGALAVNGVPALPGEGFLAALNLKTIDLDAWRALMDTESARTPSAAAQQRIQAWELPASTIVALQADEVVFMGKHFERVVAGVNRRDGMWHANIDARQVAGTVSWSDSSAREPSGRVVARLARLSLEQSQSNDVVRLLDTAPAQDVPALDVTVDDFDMRGKKFGRLELVANNVGGDGQRQWQLERLVLANPDAKFNATGSWERAAGAARPAGATAAPARGMRMNFTLDVANVGRFLDRLGVRDTMRDGTAKLEGEVSWLGSPLAIDYPTLGGKLALSADHGQFLKSEPGVARLIGVLSLQSLARRMTLDFRDVFAQGFAFDTVRANIALANGVASTSDFRMRGVAATVVMEGSADIARETQNLHMIVLPDINATGASVVYGLLANPVVGLGTFLAQLFLREPLMKALSHEYRVTGPWSDPQVEKIERKAGPETTVPAG